MSSMKIRDIIDWSANYFSSCGIENSRLESEFLMSYVLNINRLELYLKDDREVDFNEYVKYQSLLKQRAERIPLSYITGEHDFMGLKFTISRDVLIPRSETELLVEAVLKYISSKELRLMRNCEKDDIVIVDVGCGSGNIAVSLAKYCDNCHVYALDISPDALRLTYENCLRNDVSKKVSILSGDLLSPLDEIQLRESVDIIVSNPPYIATDEFLDIQPEVRCEPRIALDGGVDGLDYYRRLCKQSVNYLKTGGCLFLEVGYAQADEVKGLINDLGRSVKISLLRDYSGVNRIVSAQF